MSLHGQLAHPNTAAMLYQVPFIPEGASAFHSETLQLAASWESQPLCFYMHRSGSAVAV